jgi:lysozyme family protein
MARRVSRKSQEQILMQEWWVRAIIAIVSVGLAYGFASAAIDSGNLLAYAAAIGFLFYAARNCVKAVRYAF